VAVPIREPHGERLGEAHCVDMQTVLLHYEWNISLATIDRSEGAVNALPSRWNTIQDGVREMSVAPGLVTGLRVGEVHHLVALLTQRTFVSGLPSFPLDQGM